MCRETYVHFWFDHHQRLLRLIIDWKSIFPRASHKTFTFQTATPQATDNQRTGKRAREKKRLPPSLRLLIQLTFNRMTNLTHPKHERPLVAVIGAGVVGLTTALLLQCNHYGKVPFISAQVNSIAYFFSAQSARTPQKCPDSRRRNWHSFFFFFSNPC